MPDDDSDAGTVQVSARIPPEYLRGLEEKARENDRSLSGEIRRAIRLYLRFNSQKAREEL